MSRNRRNIRRVKNKTTINVYLALVIILLLVITICIGINIYYKYDAKKILAEQKAELERQSQEIYTQINDSIKATNKNISESDVLIKMSAVGDILCSEEMLKDAYNKELNTYDFSYMFSNVSGFINNADIVMGTMETGIVNKEYSDKNAPIKFAEAVKNSGVNLVSIAHNHSLDNGIDGLQETRDNLLELGYDVIGDKLENSNSVILKEVKNTKIAFLTYTCFLDNEQQRTEMEKEYINMYSKEQVLDDVEYAKNNGAKFICVLIHWGDAISETINQEQRDIADFLIDNDIDLIIGAHPSVVQPMEVRKNKDGENVFIAYSIGTYISTLNSEEARTELVLNIELRRSGTDGKVYLNRVDYTPIFVLKDSNLPQNRIKLIDMKATAISYVEGNIDIISKDTYDELIRGLDRLNNILTSN